MLFNVNKCSVMHMESRNRMMEYEFGRRVLNQSEQERDLGMIMRKSGRSSIQCTEV